MLLLCMVLHPDILQPYMQPEADFINDDVLAKGMFTPDSSAAA